MPQDDWFTANLTSISQRLYWLTKKPEGVIHDRKSPLHRIVIRKEGTQIRLYFADPRYNATALHSSGIMSRIDLEDPLNLLGTYTQAMMLSLLWRSEPIRVYMLGFGGGRIPMVLHHYFPEVIIESTDIDPEYLLNNWGKG